MMNKIYRVILLSLIALALGVGIGIGKIWWNAKYASQIGVILGCTDNQEVFVKDDEGNVWTFFSSNEYEIDEPVLLILDNQRTYQDKKDDEIIEVYTLEDLKEENHE